MTVEDFQLSPEDVSGLSKAVDILNAAIERAGDDFVPSEWEARRDAQMEGARAVRDEVKHALEAARSAGSTPDA
jgi:hypothetical protein